MYWKVVKEDPEFVSNPIFRLNDGDFECGHRNRANYADHLGYLAPYRRVDARTIKSRIDRMSQIELSAPPVPHRDRFPDLHNVQLIAYHRLVHYRGMINQVLGGTNKYWVANRDPEIGVGLISYQLAEQPKLYPVNVSGPTTVSLEPVSKPS